MPQYSIIYGKDFLKDLNRIIRSGDKKIKGRVEDIIKKIETEPHKRDLGLTLN